MSKVLGLSHLAHEDDKKFVCRQLQFNEIELTDRNDKSYLTVLHDNCTFIWRQLIFGALLLSEFPYVHFLTMGEVTRSDFTRATTKGGGCASDAGAS